MRFIKSHPVISGVLLVDILAAIVAVFVIVFNMSRNSQLEILVTPTSAKVIINGKEYENGTYTFFPGEYTAKIEAEGFESEEKTIKLENGQITKLYEFLTDEKGSFNSYSAEDIDILKKVGTEDDFAKNFLEKYEKKIGIKKVLPINYYVDSGTRGGSVNLFINGGSYADCPESFCLAITDLGGGNKETALDLIREKGYDPKNYVVLYEEKTMNYLHENPR